MSTLNSIPLQALLPLSAYELSDLRQEANRTNQVFLQADCVAEKDKDAVLSKIAREFSFPSYFGGNLDALYDCVTDLEPNEKAKHPGFVVVLQSLPNSARFNDEQRNRLLDVFRDAADFFSDRKIAFRVFYSTANEASSAA